MVQDSPKAEYSSSGEYALLQHQRGALPGDDLRIL
jgi:hypothetical protein